MKKENKKIKNASLCAIDNIQFKSRLEKLVYSTLKEKGITSIYEPYRFKLLEFKELKTPFYDKETDSEYKKRIKNGDKEKARKLSLKSGKLQPITYTPDFYFCYGNLRVFIEVKGFENDVFYIKKKLFRKYLEEFDSKYGTHSIFFEIYTKTQLLQAINIIKEYEKCIED